MSVIMKAVALLEAVTDEEIEALPSFARTKAMETCMKLAIKCSPNQPQAMPKSGVLRELADRYKWPK
jgi:hypothetical protein